MGSETWRDPLDHLHPSTDRASRFLLERMWSRLDHALAVRRLETGVADLGFGPVRTVTALGLIQMRIDDRACELWGGVVTPEGAFRRIGWGLPATRLLWVDRCPLWWLRFAFQTWIPERSTIDFVECPLNRPDNIELDTSRMLVRRLGADARFRTLPEEFDEAIGLSTILEVMREKQGYHVPVVEHASHVWQVSEALLARIRRAER